MDDAAIIDLFFERDVEAIRQMDAHYGQRLFDLADNILNDLHWAEETLGQTYFGVWEAIPPCHPEYFFGYLARICRQHALEKLDWVNAARRKADVVSLTEEMEKCIPAGKREAKPDGKALGAAMNRFLEGLSQESRVIFLRRYWFCDTVAEIAQRYRISQSRVKFVLHRTRRQLAEFLNRGEPI